MFFGTLPKLFCFSSTGSWSLGSQVNIKYRSSKELYKTHNNYKRWNIGHEQTMTRSQKLSWVMMQETQTRWTCQLWLAPFRRRRPAAGQAMQLLVGKFVPPSLMRHGAVDRPLTAQFKKNNSSTFHVAEHGIWHCMIILFEHRGMLGLLLVTKKTNFANSLDLWSCCKLPPCNRSSDARACLTIWTFSVPSSDALCF